MKKVDYLIITNTETNEDEKVTKPDVITMHTSSVSIGGKGWNRPAFDYLIELDGTLTTILPEESPTRNDLFGIDQGDNGLLGIPKYIAYAGGKTPKGERDKDTRTKEQSETIAAIVKFYIKRFPKIVVMGFDQIPNKKGVKAPSFDVSNWCAELGVPEENIFKTH